jgi:hypothetical protein
MNKGDITLSNGIRKIKGLALWLPDLGQEQKEDNDVVGYCGAAGTSNGGDEGLPAAA